MATKEQIAGINKQLGNIQSGLDEYKTNLAISESLTKLGIDPDTVPESFRASLASIGDVLTKQFESGPVASFDIAEALKVAQSDPDIATKYRDSLKISTEQLQDTIKNYQSELTQGLSDTQRNFIEDKKAVDEAAAAAGRVYSGFRGQAQDKLSKDTGSIIESTRREAQKALKSTQSAFEQKYGTKALDTAGGLTSLSFQNPLTGIVENISATPTGGITGTEEIAKKEDILSKQADILSLSNTK